MNNFLFNGTWGFVPKPVFWFLLGLLIASVIEWGSNDGVKSVSWGIIAICTMLAIYSLRLTLKSER